MEFYQKGASTVRGGAAVAVPGQLRGMEALHQRYGRLPWSKLFEASIRLAKEGQPMGGDLYSVSALSATPRLDRTRASKASAVPSNV